MPQKKLQIMKEIIGVFALENLYTFRYNYSKP